MSGLSDNPDHEAQKEVGDLLCLKGGLDRHLSFYEAQMLLQNFQASNEDERPTESGALFRRRSNLVSSTFPVPSELGSPRSTIPSISGLAEHATRFEESDEAALEKTSLDLSVPTSSPVHRDHDGFDSQVSLSSSTSNTTCTTSSQIGSTGDEGVGLETKPVGLIGGPESEPIEFLVNPLDMALSMGMVLDHPDLKLTDPRDGGGFNPNTFIDKLGAHPRKSLHESLSTETIKSESNPSGGAGVSLFKKQLKKRFGNPSKSQGRIQDEHSQDLRSSVILNGAGVRESKDTFSIRSGRSSVSSHLDEEKCTGTQLEDVTKQRFQKRFGSRHTSGEIRRALISPKQPQKTSVYLPGARQSRDNLSIQSNRSLAASYPEEEDHSTSIQLDDLELSGDSDEECPAPRKLRRLPGAGDLKQALATVTSRRSFFGLNARLKPNASASARLSTDTSSSIGTKRVPSIAASMFRRSKLASVTSLPDSQHAAADLGNNLVSDHDPADEAGGIAVVANFVAEGLDSDEDEPGDVEAALRRLEGVIDADRELEKAKKVERQMMKSIEASRRSRSSTMTSSHTYSSSSSLAATDEEEEGDEIDGQDEDSGSVYRLGRISEISAASFAPPSVCSSRLSTASVAEVDESQDDEDLVSPSTTIPAITFDHVVAQSPIGSQTSVMKKTPLKFIPHQGEKLDQIQNDHGSANELALRKFVSPVRSIESSRTGTSGSRALDRKKSLHKFLIGASGGHQSRPTSLSTAIGRGIPHGLTGLSLPVHRSFLLHCRTQILAEQFCLIERDLLRKITWQELLLTRWQEDKTGSKPRAGGEKGNGTSDEINCWESFIKQRAREKAERRRKTHQHDTTREDEQEEMLSSEIGAAIVRFNLTCNWVASEIVLTKGLEDRVQLLGKFIRLAFVSVSLSSKLYPTQRVSGPSKFWCSCFVD